MLYAMTVRSLSLDGGGRFGRTLLKKQSIRVAALAQCATTTARAMHNYGVGNTVVRGSIGTAAGPGALTGTTADVRVVAGVAAGLRALRTAGRFATLRAAALRAATLRRAAFFFGAGLRRFALGFFR
jgi:hypothetical protein